MNGKVVFLVVIIPMSLLALAPTAYANDLMDWVQSPGSETLSLGDAFLDFSKGALFSPDGFVVGQLGGETGALYLGVDKARSFPTGLKELPLVEGAVMIGVTVKVDSPDTVTYQPIAGVGIRLVNGKGGQLLYGIRMCSADFSDAAIDLGPLGRVHFAQALEYRIPIGGG